MRTIWKFPIFVMDSQGVSAPAGWRPLHVDLQNDTACIWAEVDTTAPLISYTVHVYGTGHPVDHDRGRFFHAGTFLQGPFVWHVYAEVSA